MSDDGERLKEFFAEAGPLVEGLADSPRAGKIHAVRANQERAWCGRWDIHAITPHRKWEPDPTRAKGYCAQCVNVWKSATKANDFIETIITSIESVIIERTRREASA